jgi:hypothetical protein
MAPLGTSASFREAKTAGKNIQGIWEHAALSLRNIERASLRPCWLGDVV